MKTRNLQPIQEPAMLQWLVYDEADPEDGYFYGPTPRHGEVLAFIEGYELALMEFNTEEK